MTALALTDRQAVLAAVVEYDAVGRRAFLDKYGYGPAREYYLMVDGKRYDSKAIAGVAYGHEHPDHGPLLHREFSGGEATVKRVLKDLGFTVVRSSGNDTPSGALVLVENEVTMGHVYDFWADDTGVQYHFPNVYRNRVQTGLPFIYYRGVRRQGNKRGPAGYFGTGTVGEIRPDLDQPQDTPNRLRRWYCAVDDYVPFVVPVPAKVGQAPYEPISGALGWRTGVRYISQAVYEAILTAAGLRPLPPLPVAAKASEVQPTESEPGDLMATRRLSAGAPGTGASAPRSPRAKQIGDWAEELVYRRLCATLPEQARDTVDWVAQRGETPGWDIAYRSEDGVDTAVEVKATTLARFTAIELTANEWTAAQAKGPAYAIALVTGALTAAPRIAMLWDPAARVAGGSYQVEPVSYRLVHTEEG